MHLSSQFDTPASSASRSPLLSPSSSSPRPHSIHTTLSHIHSHSRPSSSPADPITPITIPIKPAPIHAHAGVYSAQWVAINPTIPTHSQLINIIQMRSISPSINRYFSESYNFLQYNMGTLIVALCIYTLILLCTTWIHAVSLHTVFPTTYNHINSGYLIPHTYDHLVDEMPANPTLKHGWERYQMVDSMWNAAMIMIQEHSTPWMMGISSLTGLKQRWSGIPVTSPSTMTMNPPTDSPSADITPFTWSRYLFSTTLVLIESIFLFTPAIASLYIGIFQAMRANAPLSLTSLFSCFHTRMYWKLLPLSFSLWCIQYIATATYVIPGIYFWCATVAVLPLYVQHHLILSRTETIRYSILLFHRYVFILLPFICVSGMITCIGILSFFFGILLSTPIIFVAWIYCYHHLIGVIGVTLFLPRSSPYLELMSVRTHHDGDKHHITLNTSSPISIHPAQDAL